MSAPDRGSWAEKTVDDILAIIDASDRLRWSADDRLAAHHRLYAYLTRELQHFNHWTLQLHALHCRDDRCNGGMTCSCPCHSGWLSSTDTVGGTVIPHHNHEPSDGGEFFCPNDCPRLTAIDRELSDRRLLPLVNMIRNKARQDDRLRMSDPADTMGGQRLATQVDQGGEPLTITITIGR